jgi:hypothetical protein
MTLPIFFLRVVLLRTGIISTAPLSGFLDRIVPATLGAGIIFILLLACFLNSIVCVCVCVCVCARSRSVVVGVCIFCIALEIAACCLYNDHYGTPRPFFQRNYPVDDE